jgi:arylsulfatase A-like enzyme
MHNNVLCVALLLILAGTCQCTRPRVRTHEAVNVLIILLDTVRADRLSCYGYDRPTTPNIDRIAERGVRFDNFYANSSWTLPSHASLFTGMYPAGHRATQESLRLADGPATLAEVFTTAGYQTFGASDNGIVSIDSGLARGFGSFVEVFRQAFKDQVHGESGHPNNIAFRRFLDASERKRPFFAFFNYIEAHTPYEPPEPHRSRMLKPGHVDERIKYAMGLRMSDHYLRRKITPELFSILSQLYDGEISYLDEQVGALLDVLRRDGRLRKTLVVITSDHGENIGDHGHFAHVFGLYNTLLRIPLIVVFPDGSHPGETRYDNAQLVDLFPTILCQCGIARPRRPEGRDLFAADAASAQSEVLSEYYYPRQVFSVLGKDAVMKHFDRFMPYMRRLRSIQNGSMKLIWGSNGRHELYRIDQDPTESANLLLTNPDHPAKQELLTRLTQMVDSYHGDRPLDPPPSVGWKMPGFEEHIKDKELLERLRSLGYVQ